jgi:hypothetical protein
MQKNIFFIPSLIFYLTKYCYAESRDGSVGIVTHAHWTARVLFPAGAVSPGVKRQGVKLTIHLYLLPM